MSKPCHRYTAVLGDKSEVCTDSKGNPLDANSLRRHHARAVRFTGDPTLIYTDETQTKLRKLDQKGLGDLGIKQNKDNAFAGVSDDIKDIHAIVRHFPSSSRAPRSFSRL